MPPIRSLQQPGPPHPNRIDCFRDTAVPLRFRLQPHQTLAQALTGPLLDAGFQSATLAFSGAGLSPFAYVMPGPPDSPEHAAYFSAPRTPRGVTRIEQANATFGFNDGKPMIHCHAAWTEPDGCRRGGHILPGESIIIEPADVQAWGFRGIRIETAPDAETNFTLFQPTSPIICPSEAEASGTPQPTRNQTLPDLGAKTLGAKTPDAKTPDAKTLGAKDPRAKDPGPAIQSTAIQNTDGRAVFARIKPNEDIITALETIAHTQGIPNATVRGSLGSLVGASFTHGGMVADYATEVLVREGHISNGIATLDLLVVDMRGEVHEGWLRRGENPVCITFDLVLEAA